MGERTKIAWCDHTWNPWRGCSKVSGGCAHCYAERQSRRNPAVLGVWGEDGTRVVAAEAYWRLPERWERAAAKEGVRRRVFLGSLMDFFEPWPDLMRDHDGERTEATMEALRHRVFALIDRTPHLDWLIVTKRPENIRRMWPHHASGQLSGPTRLGNVWLLVSVEDQAAADTRIPHLLACRDLVPVLGLSCEPLLGPVDLTRVGRWRGESLSALEEIVGHVERGRLDWVIAGGESGPRARPCDVAWIRSLRDQCATAGVPFFAKQLGARILGFDGPCPTCGNTDWGAFDTPPGEPRTPNCNVCESDCERLRHPAGADPAEWPEDLRVREFPEATP